MITVPHSGTRWIRKCHWDVDWPIIQEHFTPDRTENISEYADKMCDDQIWVQIRDPIATWATWIGTNHLSMDWLHQSYGKLLKFVKDRPGVHIARAEDGASQYGIPNQPRTFSRTDNPLKHAVADRNMKVIQRKGANDWIYFRDTISPDIREFFEGHGYDFWWLDGHNTS